MNEFWQKTLFQIGGFTLTPAKLLGVIIVLVTARVFLYFLKTLWLGGKRKNDHSASGRKSLYLIVKYLVWVLAVSVIIARLGFDITFIVASSAALLVGLGFGLQNIFSDLVSGLFILFERKVRIGDVMEVDNIVGRIESIHLRTTVLQTRDGYNIIIPNHKFITENVINWSHQSDKRRFYVEVGVSYNSDTELVTKLLHQAATEQTELLQDEIHKPFVRLKDFADSALLFQLYFWTNDVFPVEHIKSRLRFRIFRLFKENGVTIPFPQRDLHVYRDLPG